MTMTETPLCLKSIDSEKSMDSQETVDPSEVVGIEDEASEEENVTITVHHHGNPHTLSFPPTATITDLSALINDTFSIPTSNQKLLVSKLGLLKPPFPNPSLPLATLVSHKITVMGSTTAEITSLTSSAAIASRTRLAPRKPTVKAYKTMPQAEDIIYTFTTLRPLPYLPNPARSLALLQRLKDDAGIRAVMKKHKWTVPLLTEMNPADHTSSDMSGTSRTLGLNRNAGEVIELRLRTDAYDGYRNYTTIRKTLCHELAHNVFGPHDAKFWELCRRIEREVEGADWRGGGRSVGDEDYYEGAEGEDVDDHGGWTGGEFVLGTGTGDGASTGGAAVQGLSRRDILAKAAEERIKRLREQQGGGHGESSSNNGS